MPKRDPTAPFHACAGCGYSSSKWFGRCPDCGSWDVAVHSAAGAPVGAVTLDAGVASPTVMSTAMPDVDGVLGGGLVAGGVVLLAGEPGIGKSTLVLQMLAGVASTGRKAMLVTGEESVGQVGGRATRLGLHERGVIAAAATSIVDVMAAVDSATPDVLVVDSVQTLQDPALEQAPGSVSQVRECAARLVARAKQSGMCCVMVGHVTKDGSVAGPKTLEHVVDAVLVLDGERSGPLRLLRVMKNRFGSCEEMAVFRMTESGLETVEDPSSMLLADRAIGTSGSVVFPVLEGSRPVLAEVQALVTPAGAGPPRRVPTGTDPKRLALVLAVLAQRGGLDLQAHDVFVAAAGGIGVKEPAADLALAAALLSASRDVALDPGLVVIGELGLGGEVRRVPGIDRRLSEAARLGFETAIVPRGTERVPDGMDIVEVADVRTAFHHLLAMRSTPKAVGQAC